MTKNNNDSKIALYICKDEILFKKLVILSTFTI